MFYSIDAQKIELINSSPTLSHKTISWLTSKLENESYQMTMMLLFNDKTVDVDSYINLKQIIANIQK